MKKLIAKIALVTLLVGGFAFVAEEVHSTQTTAEVTPSYDPGGGVQPGV